MIFNQVNRNGGKVENKIGTEQRHVSTRAEGTASLPRLDFYVRRDRDISDGEWRQIGRLIETCLSSISAVLDNA